MNTVERVLAELAGVGGRIKLVGTDGLQLSAPKGSLSAELRTALAEHKADIIVALSRAGAVGPDPTVPTVQADRANWTEPFPPSDLQQSFIIGSREGFEFYVRPHQYVEQEFDELDPARFETAFNAALHRQRHNLVVVGPDMMLRPVVDPAPVRVTVDDLTGLPEAEAYDRMEQVRATMRREEPAHDRWPWVTPHLSVYGPGRVRLHYNHNSLFGDAPSGVRLLADALHYYEHPDQPLPELEVSYRDCTRALAELEDGPLGQASEKYWRERMADWPEAPNLPLVAGAEHRGRSRLSRRELLIDPPLWDALKAEAQRRGLTMTTVLLGAHAEVLAYWSGSRHFLLNNMVTHRVLPLHPQLPEILGNFASLYPLEVDWRPAEGFAERVKRLQAQVLADAEHVYWSGTKVLQTLNEVRRTPGRAVCPFAVGSALFVGPTDRPSYSMLETPQTLLDTEFWELRDGRLWVIWDVIEQMFPDGLVDAMFDGFRRVLTALATDADSWSRQAFDLLPEAQRDRPATVAAPPTGLLHDALSARAADLADTTAVVDAHGTVSYGSLDAHVTALARRLQDAGVGPGDYVAVAMAKRAEQVAGVLGALTAGGAYVPIDPSWPRERLRFLLADTAATAVVTTEDLRDELAAISGVPVLTVDIQSPPVVTEPPAPVRRVATEHAYVIYTSGSTGTPKGAVLDHRGPLNTVIDINRRFGIGAGDVVFGVSSLCFDLSVYDVFGTVAAGAKLVLPDGNQTDPAAWLDTVAGHGVTVWNSVPAIMQLFTEAAIRADIRLPALRTVLLSGDWIPVGLPAKINQIAPNARVISLGGATEASIWSIFYPIDEPDPSWVSVPYGKPLTGQSWHILDEHGRDAPTWTTGHLHIGGVGVALGYLGDADRTAAAFVRHPVTGERLYRTGDLGRYLPDGNIEFLGRADFQIKIQGFRVEPGEIEQALLECAGVEQATVLARATGSGRQLAAFVVGPDAAQAAALRAELGARLPAYMIPSAITALAALPLTGNGKLDRVALESLARPERTDDADAAPSTATETALARIWAEILSVDAVGPHDDFFDLGGQSFAALRVIGRIAEVLGDRVPMGVLLERRTVRALADFLDSAPSTWSPLVRLRTGGTGTAWSLVHPAGGNVLCYRWLAEMLDRPSCAFQAPGPATGHPALSTVEEFARLYVAALREAQPEGPYLLGGWSSGAVIALEMAHQMESRASGSNSWWSSTRHRRPHRARSVPSSWSAGSWPT